MRLRRQPFGPATGLTVAVLLTAATTMAAANFEGSATASGSFTTATLGAPTALSAGGSSAVTLNWTASPSAFASGTRVLRGTNPGGPYTQVAEINDPAEVSYVDIPGPGTFRYVVQAYYRQWTSALSNEVDATVQSTSLVQKALIRNTVANMNATELTATFTTTPAVGHLLIGVAATRAAGTINVPSGWTLAIESPAGPQPHQAIFYKLAGVAEPKAVTVSTTADPGMSFGVHIYEYTGVSTLIATGTASGTAGTAPGSGTVTLPAPFNTLVFAALVSAPGAGYGSWTSQFSEKNDFNNLTGVGTSIRARYGAADAVKNVAGAVSTSATIGTSSDWRGQIVAFI